MDKSCRKAWGGRIFFYSIAPYNSVLRSLMFVSLMLGRNEKREDRIVYLMSISLLVSVLSLCSAETEHKRRERTFTYMVVFVLPLCSSEMEY